MNGDPERTARARQILEQLKARTPTLLGAMLVAPDGLLVAHNLPPSENLEKIAAMTTALAALGLELSASLQFQRCKHVRIVAGNGEIVLLATGDHTLAAVAQAPLDPGMVEAVLLPAAAALNME